MFFLSTKVELLKKHRIYSTVRALSHMRLVGGTCFYCPQLLPPSAAEAVARGYKHNGRDALLRGHGRNDTPYYFRQGPCKWGHSSSTPQPCAMPSTVIKGLKQAMQAMRRQYNTFLLPVKCSLNVDRYCFVVAERCQPKGGRHYYTIHILLILPGGHRKTLRKCMDLGFTYWAPFAKEQKSGQCA